MYLLKPSESIHREVHPSTVQFLFIISGSGLLIIDNGKKSEPAVNELYEGWSGIIDPNTYHTVQNNSDTKELKMFSIYAPDEFKQDRIDPENIE